MAYTIASLAAALTMAIMTSFIGVEAKGEQILGIVGILSMAAVLFPFVFVLASPVWLIAKIVLRGAVNDTWWLFAMCGGFGGLVWGQMNYETFPHSAIYPVSGVVGGMTYWWMRRLIRSHVKSAPESIL